MHEVGVANSILNTAIEAAKKNGAAQVLEVGVRIGALSGVEQHSLKFAFDAMKAGTIANKAEMVIEYIAAVGECSECGKQSTPDTFYSMCSHCGSPTLNIIAGKEFNIGYVDAE
jgi:hydrogenase nickel incorporation protein HypA/HybF